VFSHGWGEDSDGTINGGLQLSSGDWGDKTKQVSADDFLDERIKGLGNRFADGADVYFNACRTARGTLPQTMADVYDVTVYAYEETLSFFETVGIGNSETEFTIPYVGFLGNLFSDSEVEMSPSIGVWNFVVPNRSIESRKFFPNAAMQRAILRN
jgi:hypothetical protein